MARVLMENERSSTMLLRWPGPSIMSFQLTSILILWKVEILYLKARSIFDMTAKL